MARLPLLSGDTPALMCHQVRTSNKNTKYNYKIWMWKSDHKNELYRYSGCSKSKIPVWECARHEKIKEPAKSFLSAQLNTHNSGHSCHSTPLPTSCWQLDAILRLVKKIVVQYQQKNQHCQKSQSRQKVTLPVVEHKLHVPKTKMKKICELQNCFWSIWRCSSNLEFSLPSSPRQSVSTISPSHTQCLLWKL